MTYLFDTNSLIESKKKFYAFDIAPGFWKQLESIMASRDVRIPEIVVEEISRQSDDLKDWIEGIQYVKEATKNPEHIQNYSKVMNYISSCGYYNERAVSSWAQRELADPWLVAEAMSIGATIVSFERPNHDLGKGSKQGKVHIPDVAIHFGVQICSLYDFMREFGIKL